MKKKNQNKFMQLAVCVLTTIIVISVPIFCLAQTQKEQEDVIYIYSAQDLIELSQNCVYDKWSADKTVLLMNDISLQGTDFEPIPYFSGTFDGQGYTISDLELDGNYYPAGLFGTTDANSVIKNLHVTGSVIPGGEKVSVGGIVGINGGILQEVSFSGVVSGETSVGGIVGLNKESGIIKEAEVKGNIFGEQATGGIVGRNLGKVLKCDNKSYVNNSSADKSISLEDISTNVVRSLYSFGASDVVNSFTDTGGIAGYSSGMLISCRNEGTIGYPRVGYNAGGIAGRSCGFVQNCENTGQVLGRKDVGGIIGQAEPFLDIEISQSDLVKIDAQLNTLKTQLDTAAAHIDQTGTQTSVYLENIDKALDPAIDNVKQLLDKIENIRSDNKTDIGLELPDIDLSEIDWSDITLPEIDWSEITYPNLSDNIQSNKEALEAITASLRNTNEELSAAQKSLSNEMEQTAQDLRNIHTQMNDVFDTMDTLLDNIKNFTIEDIVEDVSSTNAASIVYGKITGCTNQGNIEADINAGGIVGNMSVEYEIDPEDDTSANLSLEERRKYQLKAVILECVNKGDITAKKNNAAGICAAAKLGYITHCAAYGDIKSESGDYVGGIAGTAYITIDNCITKCSLSGDSYVGGILGCGLTEKNGGSTVSECYSLVEITDCEQFEGAIAGSYDGSFADNYFVSEKLQGINRVSYQNAAQKISYDDLMQLKNIPKELKRFTLQFVADGEIIQSLNFNYGESFTEAIFPEVPPKEGYDAQWNTKELNNLCFDTVVEAEYTSYITALACENMRDGERPVFLVEGAFSLEDTVYVQEAEITSQLEEAFAQKGKVKEYWKVSFADDGQKRHDIRFLPAENLENAKLYIKEDGTWSRIKTEEFGSYKVFRITGTELEMAVVSIRQDILFAGICATVLLLAICGLVLLGKRKRVVSSHFSREPEKKSKNKKKGIAVILCIAAAGVGAICYIARLPQVRMSIELAQISKEVLSLEEQSMKLMLVTDIGDMHTEWNSDVYVCKENDMSIVALEENGRKIYMTGDAVFLENGKGYSIGSAVGNDLLKQVQKLYKATEVTRTEEEDGQRYSIKASGEGAKELIALLVPAAKEQLSDVKELTVYILANDGRLEAIEIHGAASLNDSMETQMTLSAEITDIAPLDRTNFEIPQEIIEKIAAADTASLSHMDTEMYHLLLAWINFSGKEQSGTVSLDISCGPVNLKTEHDWRSILKGVSGFSNEANMQTLPNLIYELCMNGTFSHEKSGNNYKFKLELDQATMQTLAELIAPEIKTQAVTLKNGTVKVSVKDDEIQSFEIEIDGSVKILLSEVEAYIQAEFVFR